MGINIWPISRESVFKGRIAEIIHQVIEVNNKRIEYEIIHRTPIVVIVPILSSKKLILVRQYRASLDKEIWEFPAGTIENKESIIDAARRELEEETGYETREIELLTDFYTAPHFSDERIYICLAKNLLSGITNLQEKELITTYQITESELDAKIKNREIIDAKTLVAFSIFKESMA